MLVLLLGILGGLIAFGLLGLLIGPALLAMGYALVSEWSGAPPAPHAPEAAVATSREQPAE
jgi:predicted PurR-regulated permease PerM